MARHSIPTQLAKKSKGKIPEDATIIPEKRDPEATPFQISFRYYNKKACQIKDLQGNGSKTCLEKLRDIGMEVDKTLEQLGIGKFPVRNEGTYSFLFGGKVTPDTEMKEHKIMGTQRIFYFTQDNQFHVVAITNAHIPLGKVRH